MAKRQKPFSKPGMVAKALHALVSKIPPSQEPPDPFPTERARSLAKAAALKAAAVAGTFSLPPGPFGLMTVIPDLLSIWQLQRQLVADIAGAYGQTNALTPETMTFCLFKHGGAFVTHGILARAGEDKVARLIANRTLQQLLEKIAIRVMQRLAAKSLIRWIPLVGAVGAGAYVYYDTAQVAGNAIGLFSSKVKLRPDPGIPRHPPRTPRKTPKKLAAG